MIDALFGSKTRVKLLHLFFNNPGKAFYVREITRLIDEQINSVRRELSNLMDVGVINSDSKDNKLYYEVNQKYQFYAPFRSIFAGEALTSNRAIKIASDPNSEWADLTDKLSNVRVVIASGALVKGSASPVDLLVVGGITSQRLKAVVKSLEKKIDRELNYSLLSYDEFYYRLSVRDKFINEILQSKHIVLVDTEDVLKATEE